MKRCIQISLGGFAEYWCTDALAAVKRKSIGGTEIAGISGISRGGAV
ncbi:hypothetical protein [Lachnoclostridium phytofermentans]|nr:hypothetical protein [Lachnoclostridium phytofermentans]